MKENMKISVSFLSSYDKAKDLRKLNVTDVDYIHVDYMDGRFVPYKSLSFRQLKTIYKYTSKRLDVHLMTRNPEKLIRQFATLNTEFITFHVEIKKDISKLIDLIHSYGIKAGLSIKPDTPIALLEPYLEKIDLILVMSVEPGRGGQEFLENTPSRVLAIKNLLKTYEKSDILLSIDGGINNITKEGVQDLVDIMVSGSYITTGEDFQERIHNLRTH